MRLIPFLLLFILLGCQSNPNPNLPEILEFAFKHKINNLSQDSLVGLDPKCPYITNKIDSTIDLRKISLNIPSKYVFTEKYFTGTKLFNTALRIGIIVKNENQFEISIDRYSELKETWVPGRYGPSPYNMLIEKRFWTWRVIDEDYGDAAPIETEK